MNTAPNFLLTSDTYAARGFVLVNEHGRYIGYDTTGTRIFDRKDLTGAGKAAESKGMRLVTAGYYGVSSSRPEGVSTAQHLRDQDAEAAQRKAVETERAAWLPMGNRLPARWDDKPRDVIGDVTQARAGNSVFRVGAMDAAGGWQQSAHVVLTPAERDWLIGQLLDHQAKHPATTDAEVAA